MASTKINKQIKTPAVIYLIIKDWMYSPLKSEVAQGYPLLSHLFNTGRFYLAEQLGKQKWKGEGTEEEKKEGRNKGRKEGKEGKGREVCIKFIINN